MHPHDLQEAEALQTARAEAEAVVAVPGVFFHEKTCS